MRSFGIRPRSSFVNSFPTELPILREEGVGVFVCSSSGLRIASEAARIKDGEKRRMTRLLLREYILWFDLRRSFDGWTYGRHGCGSAIDKAAGYFNPLQTKLRLRQHQGLVPLQRDT